MQSLKDSATNNKIQEQMARYHSHNSVMKKLAIEAIIEDHKKFVSLYNKWSDRLRLCLLVRTLAMIKYKRCNGVYSVNK